MLYRWMSLCEDSFEVVVLETRLVVYTYFYLYSCYTH